MIRRLALEVSTRLGLRGRLILGFTALICVAVLGELVLVGTRMRDRIYRSADAELSYQAHVLQGILQDQEKLATDNAIMAVSLQGMEEALTRQDAAQIRRMLIPIMISQELDSIYIISGDRHAVLLMGEPMADEARVASSRLVDRGFDSPAASGLLEYDQALWLGAVAAHRGANGQPDQFILLGKRFDSEYLQSLSDLVGPDIVLGWGNGVVYSLDPIPAELDPVQLQNYHTYLAEYHDGPNAFRSMTIGDLSYRMLAFDFSSRSGRPMVAYLLRPAAQLDASVQSAMNQTIAIGVILILLGTVLAFIYVQSVTGPLARLQRAARKVAQGNLNGTVHLRDRDDIGQLAQVFEKMRASVQEMREKQERWNADLEIQVQSKTRELQELVGLRDELMCRMLGAQEEERRRIARELHDETSQALTSLQLHLATAELSLGGEARSEITQAQEKTSEILREVNRIILDLRPTLLDDFGLAAALSWYASSRFENTGTKLEILAPESESRLPPAVEIALFRVGQEAISNAALHACAKNLRISLLRATDADLPVAILSIEDDGCGFDVRVSEMRRNGERPRFGLLGMQERITLVGGQIEIWSDPGQGTRVTAEVPLCPAGKEGPA